MLFFRSKRVLGKREISKQKQTNVSFFGLAVDNDYDHDQPAQQTTVATTPVAVTIAPSVLSQTTLITSMDGNVQLQDAQPTSLGTNRIKINITKNVSKIIVNSENTNKTISEPPNASAADISLPEEEISFTFKNSMKSTAFKKMPVVKTGQDTSGLCSIM